MDFTYSFVVNSRPSCHGTVRLPLNINGNMVVFGQFRPDKILNKNFQLPIVEGVVHYESVDEFRKDCTAIVNRVNATISNMDLQDSFDKALMYVVDSHVRRCGRIFINDLMAYIDTYCELVLAIGCSKEHLRKQYLIILLALVEEYSNYVLEAFNDFNGNHIPFKSSERYENLLNQVAIDFPHLVR